MLQSPRTTSLWPAHANAAFWGLGNGLTSTTLATYLARELGAEGLAVGLIVASPNLAGILRLAAPPLLRSIGSRKTFAIATFSLSGVLLLLLPMLAWPGLMPAQAVSLTVLVTLWGLWHLAMFLGVISLWSWFGDLVPGEVRGKFIGRRQGWLMAGQVIGMLAAGLFAYWLARAMPELPRWQPLAFPAMAGAVCMLLAVIPLVALPSVPLDRRQIGRVSDGLRALTDRRFLPLLGFWCWAGVANGFSQAAQGLFPFALGLPVLAMLALQAGMQVGQAGASPTIGRWADRLGSRRLMIGSQILVSAALLFYVPATREAPYWIVGAWILWIAYAGLNVCLPHMMLRLSPGENSPPYIATYFALGGLATAISSVVFGAAFDALPRDWHVTIGSARIDRFQLFFLGGFALRLSAIGWLWFLPDGPRASASANEFAAPLTRTSAGD